MFSFAKCREILKNYTQDVTRVLTKLCEDLVAGAIDKTELPEMFAGVSLSVCLSACLSVCLSVCMFVFMCVTATSTLDHSKCDK